MVEQLAAKDFRRQLCTERKWEERTCVGIDINEQLQRAKAQWSSSRVFAESY